MIYFAPAKCEPMKRLSGVANIAQEKGNDMAGGPIPTNLQDMIQLISADKLQEDLFSLHAPDLRINWASLSTKRKHRAEQLAKLLTDFMRTDAGKGQGMHLFRQISTIAIINADASNAASISDQIDAHIELKNRINDVEWLSIPKKGPAILASFVNILAHREPKAGGAFRTKSPRC